MKEVLRRRLLWVAATDATFERMQMGDRTVVTGRCIHCKRRLVLHEDGRPISRATLEHIVPRHHGGAEDGRNLALACSACNAAKGHRLDCRRRDDPDLCRMIEMLRARRQKRWREPPSSWSLPGMPPGWHAREQPWPE